MPNLVALPSLEGLVDNDGKFALQHEDTYNLLRLVEAINLPSVAVSKYETKLRALNSAEGSIPDAVGSVIGAYVDARTHCMAFKRIKYPAIVRLANDVYDYARTAGSGSDDSAYTVIFETIRRLGSTVDLKEQQAPTGAVNDLIDAEVQKINALLVKSRQAFTDLQSFEDQTRKDESLLGDCIANAKAVFNAWGPILEKAMQDEIDRINWGLSHLISSADARATASSAWCECFGLVDAAAIASMCGGEAATMADRVGNLARLVSSQDPKTGTEKGAFADLDAVAALKDILGLTGPAINTIELLIGTWGAVADDLNNLKKMVNTDIREVDRYVSPIMEKKMMEKWNALADTVDKYRNAAYVAEVQSTTLVDLEKELRYRSTLDNPVPFQWPAAPAERG